MSENSWHNKSYGGYFKSLEQQLERRNDTGSTSTGRKKSKKPVQNQKFKGGVYRIRKSVVALTAVIALVIAGVTVINALAKSQDDMGNIKKQENNVSAVKRAEEEQKTFLTSYTFSDNTQSIPDSNDAKAAIIIDKQNNTVVAERNSHEKMYPASTTKIMTLIVAAEHLKDLDDTFTMTYEITDPLFVAEASVAGFLNDEVITVRDLFYGTVLPSGADAAMGLAIMTAGSEKAFVEMMNEKVAQLGLEGTHFTNVVGLHDVNNYSTAYDMAVILDTALQDDFCKKILSTYQYTTSKTPQNPDGILLSNTIFEYMYGTEPGTATILGGKTGFVNESGYCIASYGECNSNGNEYIVVTMGNSSKWPAFYGQIDLYKEFAR